MKKILILLPVIAFMFCACTTKVMVDSPENPVAIYDDITHDFSGTIKGSLANVFKATNLALERDMKFFRVGQIPKDNEWFVYARAIRDIQIVVNLKVDPKKPEMVKVTISYGEDDLVTCQKLFKAILNNMKAYQ